MNLKRMSRKKAVSKIQKKDKPDETDSHATACHAVPRNAMLRHAMPCHAMLFPATPRDAMPREHA